MTNNQTGIGICGVVVGMIIGAGAIMYTQQYSVTARLAGSVVGEESLVAFRGIDPPVGRKYRRRSISVSNRSANASKIVNEPRYPRYPTKVQPAVVVDNKCVVKIRVVAQMREAARRIIPATSQYIQLSNQIAAALNSASQSCKSVVINEQPMTRSTVNTVKPKPRVNNHCEQYDKTSQRYTRCFVNERRGQRYQGRQ